jgi:PAS domain S-box-containing protein
MIITGTDGILQLANSRTDSLFNYERDQLIGSAVTAFIPRWKPPDLSVTGIPAGTHLSQMRLEGVCRDGSVFPIEITCSPFETDEGVLITTAIRDATGTVKAEERIRRVNAELERRVAERTADLTRSNDALRQFAWAASHDLQEPIRMVLSYAQWIARSAGTKLGQDEFEMLTCVQDNAARLQTLLTDLRQYIFLSESEQQLTSLVDCNVVLETVKSYLAAAIAESGATIAVDPLPSIQSVEILLIQIFQNLMSNSIKYRSDAAPLISVRAEPSHAGWIFSVADNGIGVDPTQSEYVFGVFRRLHGRQYSGTGIGLAICKAAVERLGGRIWIEPQAIPGTTVRFLVPQELDRV